MERGSGSYEVLALRYDLEVLEGERWETLTELLTLDRVERGEEGTGERACYRGPLPDDRSTLFLRLRVTLRYSLACHWAEAWDLLWLLP